MVVVIVLHHCAPNRKCTNVMWYTSTFVNTTFFLNAAPEDAPTNVAVLSATPTAVIITWLPPLIPNGVITHYNVYVNYTDGSSIVSTMTTGAVTNFTLDGLQPFQTVVFKVSASTAIGEGPLSDPAEGRSNERGICQSAIQSSKPQIVILCGVYRLILAQH